MKTNLKYEEVAVGIFLEIHFKNFVITLNVIQIEALYSIIHATLHVKSGTKIKRCTPTIVRRYS